MILGVIEFKTSKATVGNRKDEDLFSPKGACAGRPGTVQARLGLEGLLLPQPSSLSVALPRSRPIRVP